MRASKLSVIIDDLAKIAQEHPEMTVSGEETRRRQLAEVLQKRARTVAAGTPFRVAVVGDFSRGKSTLINALLGRKVLRNS